MDGKFGEYFINEGTGTHIRGGEDIGGAQVATQQFAATFTDGPSTDGFFERRMTLCKPAFFADATQTIADFAARA